MTKKLAPRKFALLILALVAATSSRAIFLFMHDSEGPNLVIVLALGVIIFAIFLAVYFSYDK